MRYKIWIQLEELHDDGTTKNFRDPHELLSTPCVVLAKTFESAIMIGSMAVSRWVDDRARAIKTKGK